MIGAIAGDIIGSVHDTLACIAGGIDDAWYGGVPAHMQQHVMETLPPDVAEIVDTLQARLAGGTH